jgi:glycosyltransferase involved in cell wall biosynthesis
MAELTIVILTKNEASNIGDAVCHAKRCTNHVLVVDCGSEDDTVSIAEKAGATVIFRQWDNDFSAQRNFALTAVKTEWVLFLDADERLNDDLIKSIQTVLSRNIHKQYILKFKVCLFGKELNHGVLRPDYIKRMFPTNSVHWVNKVHEQPVCPLPVEKLSGYVKHYTITTWTQYLQKSNQYTSLAAAKYAENGKKSHFFTQVVLKPAWAFFKVYILQGGFLDGKTGWILSVEHYFYTMNKYVKLYFDHDKK